MNKPAYQRILLKLSGEALKGPHSHGFDKKTCLNVAKSVQDLAALNVQVGIVIGAGNLFRGKEAAQDGMKRARADQIGMLATIMNAMALQDAFESLDIKSHVMSAIPFEGVVETYSWEKAIEYLDKGTVLIFAGGTGNPYFSTDSAAALRALEIEADILLKATKVDGIYSKDPHEDPNASKFDQLSYSEVLEKQLEVMDMTSIALCRENGLPIRVFNMFDNSLKAAVYNQPVGTLVSGE